MGRELALEAFRLGAEVAVVHRDTFPCVTNIPADSAAEMRNAVLRVLKEHGGTDIYISAAAISDFAPAAAVGKISSGRPATLALEPLPKLITEVIEQFHPFVVAFKIDRSPKKGARALLAGGAGMVLMNQPETMGSPDGSYTLLDNQGVSELRGTKEETAAAVFRGITKRLQT
jgi:phosphopantothenoylcysteine decarboxylase/phosphopantothenate--cysteine ligase